MKTPPRTNAACLEHARQLFEQKRWAEARRLFEAADRDAPLGPRRRRPARHCRLCDRRGDPVGRDLERDAAHRLFRQLDAEPRWTRPASRTADQHAGPLSPRERQVLRLLTTGRTNREIGKELSARRRWLVT